ncbi:hypothetical protein EPN28_00075 [Patescibacteria group bacterium]|nr:MAG: hypothetical protein EPN28_00075 [Patescibacteria group bacterium]
MYWIDKFNKGMHQAFAGNVLEAFQPLDFFHFYPLWYDLWVEHICNCLKKIEADKKTFNDVRNILPTPSSMRAIILKIISSWRTTPNKNWSDFYFVSNFLARMLEESSPNDPFAENSAPFHNKEETSQILLRINWQNGSQESARLCGRLITSAGSLVHGLYNDLATDNGWDNYGPYKIGNEVLLITHFPNLQTRELWPEKHQSTIKELFIYRIFQNVEWKIAGVGCHTLVQSGNPVSGLRRFAVQADGKWLNENEIANLIDELAEKAELTYRDIRKKDSEGLKKMVLWQECYQLKKLSEAAGLDWRPSLAMLERIKNKPLLKGLIPHGEFIGTEEKFCRAFGVNEFKRDVLGID